MKKTLLFLVLTAYTFLLSAQDSLKFSPNSWATEVNVNLFDGEISLNNTLKQVKVRYFMSDNLAYRMVFGFKNISNFNKSRETYFTETSYLELEKKSLEASVGFGFEKHFKGTNRLSPYLGMEVGVSLKRTSQTTSQNNVETTITGTWVEYEYYYDYYMAINYTERGYTAIGASIVTGVDFYVSKNLFVGFEFLYGINYKVFQDIESESSSTFPLTSETDFTYGPNIVNGIRLGYVF